MTRLRFIVALATLTACAPAGERAPAPIAQDKPAAVGADRTLVVGQAPAGAFVRLEPQFAHAFPPPTGERFMDQSGQMFNPGAMVARQGQSIQFRSSEDVLHNVRVMRADDKLPMFNVATPPWGSYAHTFAEAGSYDVTCDIHTAMRATILVTTAPYATIADENGRFSFPDVVPGQYKLVGFAGTNEVSRIVEVSGEQTELKIQ